MQTRFLESMAMLQRKISGNSFEFEDTLRLEDTQTHGLIWICRTSPPTHISMLTTDHKEFFSGSPPSQTHTPGSTLKWGGGGQSNTWKSNSITWDYLGLPIAFPDIFLCPWIPNCQIKMLFCFTLTLNKFPNPAIQVLVKSSGNASVA